MRAWGPIGTATVILSACLGLGWVVVLVAIAVADRQVSREGWLVMQGTGQTLSGAVAVLLGLQLRRGRGGDG